MIKISEIRKILNGTDLLISEENIIENLLTDSRKLKQKQYNTLFIAIKGINHNAHEYLHDAYLSGIRNFIIEEEIDLGGLNGSNIILVKSSVEALQQIGKYKREQSHSRVISITGSNGKTIIKEWLHQSLSISHSTVKSPGSYNSQIGVPLSLWNIERDHKFAIIEAGISRVGEMDKLADIINPNIGIISNIGSAHDEGFRNIEEKLAEKLKLFRKTETIIYNKDNTLIDLHLKDKTTFSWGKTENADIRILNLDKEKFGVTVTLKVKKLQHQLHLPIIDDASIENMMHVVATLFYLNYSIIDIQSAIKGLQNVQMRLEVKEGLNNSTIIDDTYNNDLAGLKTAISFIMHEAQGREKWLIISELLETGKKIEELFKQISDILGNTGIQNIVYIGQNGEYFSNVYSGKLYIYKTTEDFEGQFDTDKITNSIVLIKGARKFKFENIVTYLEKRVTGTILEININSIVKNYNYFKSLTKPNVKFMVMIKALAYGSGSFEIASALEYQGVDYFGVAYADEGVYLREEGIKTPIMVMNPDRNSFSQYLRYNLEPEVYSMGILKDYTKYLDGKLGKIHIKLETGMHRLGFNEGQLDELIEFLKIHKNLSVLSMYSHLVGADSPEHDEFTHQQASSFYKMSYKINRELDLKPLLHLLNSAGISRFPKYNFDMVRLGIGLHGISDYKETQKALEPAQKLKTIISQIKDIGEGDTVGYNRVGSTKIRKRIATIAIGYADGLRRSLSNGVGSVIIQNQVAPIIGNICMDMAMVDISGIQNVKEGDEVVIFDKNHSIFNLAESANTIPYEILTGLSERIKRVYVYQ